MTDWRDKLRELGFGNQSVIVGTKRRELFDEIEKMFVERQKVLAELRCHWCARLLGKDKKATVRQPDIFYCPTCYEKGLNMEKEAMYG